MVVFPAGIEYFAMGFTKFNTSSRKKIISIWIISILRCTPPGWKYFRWFLLIFCTQPTILHGASIYKTLSYQMRPNWQTMHLIYFSMLLATDIHSFTRIFNGNIHMASKDVISWVLYTSRNSYTFRPIFRRTTRCWQTLYTSPLMFRMHRPWVPFVLKLHSSNIIQTNSVHYFIRIVDVSLSA